MQRQYNVGLNTVTKSISQVVDKNRYQVVTQQTSNAWNSGGALSAQNLATRRNGDENPYGRNVPRKPTKYKPSIPTYASDVSHLVV